ncbi:MAG: glycosyltransferase [Cyclobacteriaceae bacterium]
MHEMNVAIVHDDLMRRGGAEQVVLALHHIYPDAPIYTLCYRPELTYPEFKSADIRTSIFDKFVSSESSMKNFFFPFGYFSMRLIKLAKYEKVILSSTFASKYIRFSKETTVINYCHNPFRVAWYPETYSSYVQKRGLMKYGFDLVLSIIRKLDYLHAQRPNVTIVNSKLVRGRVEKIYNIKNAEVVYPPVQLNNFNFTGKKKDFYLVVSRFESYKRVDLAIDAFNVSERKLIIIGTGSLAEDFRKRAKSNIAFLRNVSKEDLAEYYAQARALVFPQEEDFGITPLEAIASGTPVIAFGKGGVTETMIRMDGSKFNSTATAVFFDEQSVTSLNTALVDFERHEDQFDPMQLQKRAKKFEFERFKDEIEAIVSRKPKV